MKGDSVIVDGAAVPPEQALADPAAALATNYVYSRIHVCGGRPLNPDDVLGPAAESMRELYGMALPLDAARLAGDAHTLIRDNRYPLAGSYELTLFLFPQNAPAYMLAVRQQMIYTGYTIWHTPQRAITIRYETPLPRHLTGASLLTSEYALRYAAIQGADVPLIENFDGILTGAGEYPLFAAKEGSILASPLTSGVADCAERRVCIGACRKAGYTLTEEPVFTDRLEEYDELFYFAPQGIYPIRSCGRRTFPDIVARRIAAVL